MRFEYEITDDDYISASLLYYKLTPGRARLRRVSYLVLSGLLLITVAEVDNGNPWSPVILLMIGFWRILMVLPIFFPQRWLSRLYRGLDLEGKKFVAELNDSGIKATGEFWSWHVPWASISLKGENDELFLFCPRNAMFVFSKRYLNSEQQQELRRLSGLHLDAGL